MLLKSHMNNFILFVIWYITLHHITLYIYIYDPFWDYEAEVASDRFTIYTF